MLRNVAFALILFMCAASSAAARGYSRETPVPESVRLLPTIAVVFDHSSTMSACKDQLQDVRRYQFQRKTLRVVTGEYRGCNYVFVQDHHRDGPKGRSAYATTWVLEQFSDVRAVIAVSSSTAMQPEHYRKLCRVREVQHNGSVWNDATVAVGVVVETRDGLELPEQALIGKVNVCDQLIANVVAVAARERKPWHAFTFPVIQEHDLRPVNLASYMDGYHNMGASAKGRLFFRHNDVAEIYLGSQPQLESEAPELMRQIHNAVH